MTYDPEKHHRRSIRLKGYDYSKPGAYYVTICTQNRECLFGDIIDGEMQLNKYGKMVLQCWQWIGTQYPYIQMYELIVMPNHLHGILIILENDGRGDSRIAPTDRFKRKTVVRLIDAFKTVSTKQINKIRRPHSEKLWQRNFFEHILRNEKELNHIRKYITNNPLKWELDKENPQNW